MRILVKIIYGNINTVCDFSYAVFNKEKRGFLAQPLTNGRITK